MKFSRSLVFVGVVAALGRPGAAQATDTTWIPTSDDATLYEHPTGGLANGAGMHMFTGRTEDSVLSIRRALVRFDMHEHVKPSAEIHEARLFLHVSLPPDSSQQVSIHRVLQYWSEDTVDAPGTEEQGAPIGNRGVTWLRREPNCSGCFWSTPGGDFDPLPLATSTLTDSVGIYEWQSPSLAEAAEGWATTCGSSGGLIVLTDEAQGGTLVGLDTRNHPDSSVRPMLQVVWSGGCLIDVPGDMNASGTITASDIIYLVNFVFKAGDPPEPCLAAGDVNCSGTVTSADLIAMVHRVFFNAWWRVCDLCCSSPLAAGCVE